MENIHISADDNQIDCRFPVQYVVRPQTEDFHDYRGYAGRIAGGIFKPGDEVYVLPSGFSSKVKSIDTLGGTLEEAFAPQSVCMSLEDEIDISRGDMIVKEGNMPKVGQDLDLMVCWLNQKALVPGGKYRLIHTTKSTRCMLKQIYYKVDIYTLHRIEDDVNVGMNDIAKINIRTMEPLFYDRYQRNRNTGSLILIDEATNVTVGACMIV